MVDQVKDRFLEKLSVSRQPKESEVSNKLGDHRVGGHSKARGGIYPSSGRREDLEYYQLSHKWQNTS